MTSLVLPLADKNATLEIVGGKGASLARLANAGLPVPGGFHVTTTAYQQFVAQNDLQPRLIATLESAEASRPDTLEAASRAIHDLFRQAEMPCEIAETIAKAYAALDGGATIVAVRSSATAEDLPDLSFAGQQETFLNIRSPEAVLGAVQKCWASLWTARAIGYRLQHHIDQNGVSLAVVVQRLVPAEAAGILFTANPINGQRDQVMITATWGLGEAIVGGLVTPDTLIVEKASGKVLRRDTADKQTMTVRIEGGTEEQPVPEAMRRASVLSDSEAGELAKLGVQIENLYGLPMDIEWTLAEEKFAIVQARPITALPEPEQPTPTEWHRPDPKAWCFRSSIVEQLPDPLTPLFATLGVKIISHGSAKLFNDLLGKGTASDDIFTTINGYGYYQMRFTPRMLSGVLNAIIKFWPEFQRSEQRWRDDAHVRYVAAIERWGRQPAGALTAADLLEAARQLMAETVYTYTVLQSGVLGLAGGAEMLFTLVYDKLIKRTDDPPAAIFVLGFDSLPILAEKSLYDLARQARNNPALAEHILNTPSAQLTKEMAEAQTPPGLNAYGWQTWRRGFTTHLEQYGHTIYDLDFAKPLPIDNPAPLLETCKMYLGGRGTSPYERQQILSSRREQTAQAIFSRLKGLRLKLFRKTLGWAQRLAPMREDSLSDMGLGYPRLRQFLHELGYRLTQAGLLERPDDVYWLYEEEVDQAAASLDECQPVCSLAEAIRKRKAVWKAQKRLTPPTALPERSRFSGYMEKIGPSNTAQAAGNVLKGAGASQGYTTGQARVLHGPEDFAQMRPGEILVAAITTPAWTPLFAMASAIVTDVGGLLSHSSIVAREYGIPAVLGTGVATKRIHSGDTVTVDGTEGKVYLKARGATAIEWRPPNPKGIYMRTGVVDLMPNPLSPLYSSWAIPVLREQMQPLGARLGMGLPVLQEDYYTTINNYAYMNAAFPAKAWWWILTGMLPAYPSLLGNLVRIWRDELHPEYQAAVVKYRDQAPEKLSAGALWQEAQELLTAAMYYACGLLFATMGASAGSEGLLTRVYDKFAKQEGDPEANVLLMGWNNIPVRSEKSLYDIAGWIREDERLSEYVRNTAAPELAMNLEKPASVPVPMFVEFAARFQRHLERFGHLIFQMDFAEPLPSDRPEMLLETIKLYLSGRGTNPHERQRASEMRRIQTSETMRNRLKGLKRWAFSQALNWGQSLAEVREDALAEIGLGYPALRAMLRELGGRLVTAGALQHADDIFWLEKGEVADAVRHLDDRAPLGDLSERVAQRKAFNQKIRRETPPPMMPMKKRYMGIDTSVWLAESEQNRTGSTLKGVATSAGSVTAPACVLHGPEDFNQMKPGAVLVAGTTTPAWTPLFAMASAVVTDIGGPLSHGSIVAREYGIPAVMGTGVATRRIHSGDMITVDGGAGIVTLSHNGRSS